MAFDPTLPVNNSPIISAQLRNQFNGLLALTAQNPVSLHGLGLTVSDPPTQAEVQAIADKVNELIFALKRFQEVILP